MDAIRFVEQVELDRPPVICAFRGWNDGGEAASVAARYLIERWNARPFAYLDPDDYVDFQVTRPTVRLANGVSRVIEWPRGEFHAASVRGRDVVVYVSVEPNMRWRGFTKNVIDVARHVGSELLVTLGAFLTDVPHTRTVPVVGSAEDEETAARLGLARSQYEGPTGIVGVLHDASIRGGLPSVSLWAAVPHYLPAAPNPKAALALVERTSALLDLPVDTSALVDAVGAWNETVERLLSQNDELADYVRRLEAAAEEGAAASAAGDQVVPSGEVIAAELERFLREREGGAPPD